MKVGMIAGSFLFCNVLSAQFTNGNIVVLQAGDGTLTYTGNVASPAILQEFTPLGNPTYSLALPTGTAGITVTGNDITEGLITRSTDGHYIVIAGYNTTSGTAAPSTASASVVPRGIAKVNPVGSYSLAVTTNTFYSDNISGDGIGSATADGNGNVWGCGHVSGITAFVYNGVTATTGSTILTSPPSQNTRAVAVYNGQLYYSTGSVSHGLFMVGTGTPTAPTTTSLVVALGSPYQFAFDPTGNTLYIADKTAGLQKWTFSSSTWTNVYTYTTTANAIKTIGLVADFSGVNPIIYATTANGASLIAITDGGSLATSTITTLATAPVNTTFRGLAFSPKCAGTSLSSITSFSSCAGSSIALTPTLLPNGTGASYTLTTPSGASSLSTALAALSSTTAGTYPCTLTAQDGVGCTSNSQTFTVTINNCATGIKINSVELATTIAPNPAKESVEILFSTNANKNIYIVNSLGQTVLTKNTNDMNVKLDVSGFPQGIYFVIITSGSQKAIKKLIVQ